MVGREPDHAIAGLLVGLADGRHGEAFAGAGLAVDDRQALFAGGVAKGAGLLARNSLRIARRRAPRARSLSLISCPLWPASAWAARKHMQLGLQHGARSVAGDFAVRCGREPDQLGMGQHGAFKPREQSLVARPVVAVPAGPDDFFFERAMQLARREGRSLLGHRPQHGAGIAGADRGAQLVGILPAQRNDAAMLTLIVQGPIGKLDLAALEIVGATGRRD